MRFSTIIFDLDGTLLETGRGVWNGFNFALEKLGVSLPLDFDRNRIIGPPLRYGFRDLAGVDLNDVETAVRLYREYYSTKGLHEAEPYPGTMELLSELNKKGATVCLATSKYGVLAQKQLEIFGLASFFKYTAMSKESEVTTTKSEMVADLLASSKTPARDAVMIGDTKYDVMGAVKNEVPFIGVLYGYGSREEMEEAGARAFVPGVHALMEMLLG